MPRMAVAITSGRMEGTDTGRRSSTRLLKHEWVEGQNIQIERHSFEGNLTGSASLHARSSVQIPNLTATTTARMVAAFKAYHHNPDCYERD